MLRDRRTVAGAAVVILLVAAIVVWRSPRHPEESAELPPRRAAGTHAADGAARLAANAVTPGAPSGAATPAGTFASTPVGTPSPAATEEAALPDQAQIVSLGRQAANEYRRLAQYPPWSRPFNEEGEDPILRDRAVSPISAAGPNGEQPILVVFPDQVSFEAPDAVLLYAFLSVDGSRVPAASISGTIMSESLQPLATLAYADDGSGGDRVPGDAIYTVRFEPGADFAPQLSESFLVRVVAQTTDGDERLAATSFLYSNPHARLTGTYRDEILNGSLVVDAEVEVIHPGRFHLEATLYSQDGRRPVGEAHTATELGTGRQWMRLTFFGRVITQSGVEGPYLLRFVALSTTTAMPNAKNRLVENAYVTGPYRVAQFSDAPFDDRDLLDAADRLEADL
jgi:hypothetical protein